MATFKIFSRGLSDAEKAKLVELLVSIGCDESKIELVLAVPDADPECDDEIIVALASPAVCADADLEAELAKFRMVAVEPFLFGQKMQRLVKFQRLRRSMPIRYCRGVCRS